MKKLPYIFFALATLIVVSAGVQKSAGLQDAMLASRLII
jgi:hypothetical protein